MPVHSSSFNRARSTAPSPPEFFPPEFFSFAESNFAEPLTRAPIGKSPINANDNIVFPDPDSPTNPSDAPRSNRSDTSFTGRTHPPGVGNSTVNPRNSKSAFISTCRGGSATRSPPIYISSPASSLSFRNRNHKFQRRMRPRNSHHLDILQPGLAPRHQHINFPNHLHALRINNPQRSIRRHRLHQRRHALQILRRFRAKENHFTIPPQPIR